MLGLCVIHSAMHRYRSSDQPSYSSAVNEGVTSLNGEREKLQLITGNEVFN